MTHSTKESRQEKEQVGLKKNGLGRGGHKQCRWGLHKLGKLGMLSKLWQLYMSGKAFLTC